MRPLIFFSVKAAGGCGIGSEDGGGGGYIYKEFPCFALPWPTDTGVAERKGGPPVLHAYSSRLIFRDRPTAREILSLVRIFRGHQGGNEAGGLARLRNGK